MTDKLFYTVQFNTLHFRTAHATCFNVFNFKEKGHFCIVLLNLYSFISHPLLFSFNVCNLLECVLQCAL